MAETEWILHSVDDNIINDLMGLGFSKTLAIVLANRGITGSELAEKYLSADINTLYDPYLMKDMKKASERVRKAILNKEKIAVYGDYDVDGVTSTAVIFLYLKTLGADVITYIPGRENEGYGLNCGALERLIQSGVSLIITVDTGVSAIDEALFASEKGVDIIITDHHEPRETLPCACAVVNPKRKDCPYPFKELSGAGVAFKLICAMEDKLKPADLFNIYGGLVCLGTIADVVPLKDENRTFAHLGLELILNHKNAGIDALLTAAGVANRKLSANTVAFALAPRINACGRMSSAMEALKLLTESNRQKCELLAEKLNENNRERQETESAILAEALDKIKAEPSIIEKPIIIISGENWHNGVIGIVAARVSELFSKPVILISFSGEEGRASCRSISGLNIHQALSECSSLLVKFGGHELAAGFSIKKENLEAFYKKIFKYASKIEIPTPKLYLDCELPLEYISLSTARELQKVEPCGNGNESPLFYLSAMRAVKVTPLTNGAHCRYTFEKSGKLLQAMMFGCTHFHYRPVEGEIADLAVNLEVNSYKGVDSPSLIIRDIRKSKVYEEYRLLYSNFYKNESGNLIKADCVPSRDDFIMAYKYILAKPEFDIETALNSLNKNSRRFNYFKLRIIMDVFEETGLLHAAYNKDKISVNINSGIRVDLGSSKLLQKLCAAGKLQHE